MDEREPQPAELLWLSRTRTFAGGVVVGLAVNAISDAYKGAAAPAVGGAVFLVALVAVELRRFPADAPVQRLVSRACLIGAAIAALVAIVASSTWRPWLVLAAAAIALTACLTQQRKEITVQLSDVAMIGAGIAGIGIGVELLLEADLLRGTAVIGLGVAGCGLGVGWMLDSAQLEGVAVIGLGVAGCGLGVGWMLDSAQLRGVAVIAAGVAVIGMGVVLVLNSAQLRVVAAIGIGVAVIGMGVVLVLDSELLAGVALIGAGVAVIGLQVAWRLGFELLGNAALIVGGVALIGLGVVWLIAAELLLGVAFIGGGLAFVGGGVALSWRHPNVAAYLRGLVSTSPKSNARDSTLDTVEGALADSDQARDLG